MSAPTAGEPLIAEDVLLMLLDDEHGAVSRAVHHVLGGAVLVELALRGLVRADGRGGVRRLGDGRVDDPLLRSAHAKITARHVDALLPVIGGSLWRPVAARLVERGLARREGVLGVVRATTWPVDDSGHTARLWSRLRAALEGGAADPRTAAVIALLSAGGALPMVRPALPWTAEIRRRAAEVERGNWAAAAVRAALTATHSEQTHGGRQITAG